MKKIRERANVVNVNVNEHGPRRICGRVFAPAPSPVPIRDATKVFSAAAATRPSRPRILVSLGVSLCVENNKQREKRGGTYNVVF